MDVSALSKDPGLPRQAGVLAYQVEAEIIGFAELPPLRDTLQTLQSSGEQFYGFFEGTALAGVVACECSDNILTICRMMVHPAYFRRGIGARLLQSVIETHGDKVMRVSTGSANEPAKNLYLRHGFREVGQSIVL